MPDRFGLAQREADGDWRDWMEQLARFDGEFPAKLRTTVTEEHPKTILTFNQSPDVGFDRSVNAYRGCEHGCIYCFARPTHAYHDLSPGLDFETKLFAKPDAARLLRETFARPRYKPKPLAMGTNTDPYQPIEGRYRITRALLEVCLEARHPVTITTKSDRVLRDLDLIAELARQRLAAVAVSITSLDARLSRLLEPRAPAPDKRLAALGRLVEAGVPAHCSVALSSRRSPTSSWRRFSPAPERSACSRRAGFRCACRTRSRRCSANGSRCISPTAPTRSWVWSAISAAGATTIRRSSRGCGRGGLGRAVPRPLPHRLPARGDRRAAHRTRLQRVPRARNRRPAATSVEQKYHTRGNCVTFCRRPKYSLREERPDVL